MIGQILEDAPPLHPKKDHLQGTLEPPGMRAVMNFPLKFNQMTPNAPCPKTLKM
jgi:hypothetical protein